MSLSIQKTTYATVKVAAFQRSPKRLAPLRMAGSSSQKHIVIAGNGIGGMATAHELRRLIRKKHLPARVTVIGASDQFTFKPFLPDALMGEKAQVPMKKEILPNDPITTFKQATVEGISLTPNAMAVKTSQGEVPFDTLVVALGSKTAYFNVPGAQAYALPLETMKTLDSIKASASKKIALAAKALPASVEQRKLLSFVIIGGGPTGIELAFEVKAYLQQLLKTQYPQRSDLVPRITVLEAKHELLPGFHPSDKAYTQKRLQHESIMVHFDHRVKCIHPDHRIEVVDNHEPDKPAKRVIETVDPIWVTGVVANPLVNELPGEKLPGNQRIKVNPFLQLPSQPNVYVIGDMSAVIDGKTGNPLPTLGQVAEQQGRFVAQDIVRQLTSSPTDGRPSFQFNNKGLMLSVGEWKAFVRSTMIPWFSIKDLLGATIRKWVYRQKRDAGIQTH